MLSCSGVEQAQGVIRVPGSLALWGRNQDAAAVPTQDHNQKEERAQPERALRRCAPQPVTLPDHQRPVLAHLSGLSGEGTPQSERERTCYAFPNHPLRPLLSSRDHL